MTLGISLFCVLLLFSTFLVRAMDGVHRWIYLGPFSINIGFLVLPILLMCINKLAKKDVLYTQLLIGISTLLFFFQPDASMLLAYSLAMIPLAIKNKSLRIPLGIMLVVTLVTWFKKDTLESVEYVDGILILAKNQSWLYLIICLISYVILLIPFLKNWKQSLSRSFVLMWFGFLFSAILGNYPVP